MLATASSQAQGACPEFIVDRFSDLPVEVSHHILSFLPFKDIRQVGCVSKRCLELYLSYPSLIFNPSHHQRNNMWRRLEAFNYFDKFLANRDSNKIECLRISWTTIQSNLQENLMSCSEYPHGSVMRQGVMSKC
ncbi:F-box/LRR-repeat protein [Prunus yedoensis var. nudiflora]|uniref:F-box/LRR-repeat protein n=1 Tax=Prunus yedoensis var. nudiflora TaxID=2094558 RepID=A0A314UME8_PRUYE|nr:F-box/LRR-repeat protein [Prunus yedoensis var. nudiflora]